MKGYIRNISIKRIIIIVFISAMFLSISSIGFLIFTKWFSSARNITESIAEDITERIYDKIYDFLHIPNHINEVNLKIIENDILDLENEKLRDKFFVGVLRTHNDEIYSFSYGTVNGEYYGARRNENGVVEIMRNNTETGGNSWYYSVNEDMTAGAVVVDAGKFDPRTREWYKAAVEAKGPAFAPVYKHLVRNDEIGKILESFNNVANNMQSFINNLENAVKDRTKELYDANVTLEDNRNQLQFILTSTDEAIYGIDLNGNCTFCNTSCIKLLGYEKQEDLLGKNMHWQIHHSRADGTPFPIDECRILKSIREGKGYEADDEVFWKADGTCFEVEYHSYPQMRNGKVVGGVITFIDISERKKKE